MFKSIRVERTNFSEILRGWTEENQSCAARVRERRIAGGDRRWPAREMFPHAPCPRACPDGTQRILGVQMNTAKSGRGSNQIMSTRRTGGNQPDATTAKRVLFFRPHIPRVAQAVAEEGMFICEDSPADDE